jgi:sodium/potassium-transporting ATPase subunit alpha
MTTLQREIFRFVVIIASLAALLAIVIVVLWAAWRVLLFRDSPEVAMLRIFYSMQVEE